MTRTAADSSVLLAAVSTWHERHEPAWRAVGAAFAKDSVLVLPSDALIETFAVLTRLPSPHRVAPQAALELLAKSFRSAEVVALGSDETWDLLQACGTEQVAGGTVYDARIVAAAVKGRASRILTFNVRHFERLAPAGLAVVVPRA